jgi:ubiquinone/menaquinone biosynthesis C-methylase UbiE
MLRMSGASFGSGYTRLDTEAEPAVLLEFLDRVAALAPVAEAKRELTDSLELGSPDHVLDLGCGTGVDLSGMAERVRPDGRVTGVDVSEQAVREAARRYAGSPDVEVQVADAHALPFPDGAFDACRADRTFQHLARPEQAVAELRRVLRPGGRLGILEMTAQLDVPAELGREPVHQAVVDMHTAPEDRRGWLTMMLPLLLVRGGFEPPEVQGAERSIAGLEAADAMLRLQDGVARAVAAGAVEELAAARWLQGLEAADTRGDVAMRVIQYRFLTRSSGERG